MANPRKMLERLNRTNDVDFCGGAPGTVLLTYVGSDPRDDGDPFSEHDITVVFRYRPGSWNGVPAEEVRQMMAADAAKLPYPPDDFSDLFAE